MLQALFRKPFPHAMRVRLKAPAASWARFSFSAAQRGMRAIRVACPCSRGMTTTPSSSATTMSPGSTRAPAQTTGTFTEPRVSLTVPARKPPSTRPESASW